MSLENDDNGIPYIEFDGHKRKLACPLDHPDYQRIKFSPFAEKNPVYSSDKWLEISMISTFKRPISDQGSSSACSTHASNKGVEYCIKQLRGDSVDLNPFYNYVLVNGGQDAGASLPAVLQSHTNNGACPRSILPVNNVIYSVPPGATKAAARFKIEDAFMLNSFEEACSAITRGFFVVYGIYVGGNFSNVDSDAVPPMPDGSTGGGHALLGGGLKKISRWGWTIETQNSWGRNFGMNGICFVHKGFFEQMFQAFAIQAVIDDPEDNTPEDEVPVAPN
jgi:hypothetical protein